MRVYDLQVKSFDKDGMVFMRVRTDRGGFSLWGRIKDDGRVVDERGAVLFRIKPEQAKRIRERVKGKLQYTFSVSRQELERNHDKE